jgi:hypothetical protein
MKVDARIQEHGLGPFLQKYFQTAELHGLVARLGRFGYVHSQ